MFWNSQSPIIKLVQASTERKAKADLALDFYHDRQSENLHSLIAARWSRPEDFRLFQINLTKKITNKRAAVYLRAPMRTFAGWDQAKGEALYRAIGANSILKKANRYTKLLRTTALQVRWAKDRPALSVVTPNILDALYTDPARPDALIVTHRGYNATGTRVKTEATEYSVWSATGYERLDYRGQPIPVDGNPDGVNPYGVLPFVSLHDSPPDDDYFVRGGDDVIEAQQALNCGLVNLWRAIELQAHGQAWAAGISAGDALQTGPDRAITLPVDGKFGFAAPGTPIAEILSALEFLAKQTAVANGLSANVFSIDQQTAESGVAKAIEGADLLEARADDIELWRGYEAELFEVLKHVLNTHQPGTIPADASVRVDFAEPDEVTDEATAAQAAQIRITSGVWSPVDWALRDNPDLGTREQALEELMRRRAETAALRPEIGAPTAVPTTATDPTPSQIETR
ncbi:hypothetical protein [Inquilinus sp. OTU3971]|uniref:hypothetical protein n=1 Tax=Inquilinus sp. OTU3971 TaxID=3043855 RepID=UPI00313BE08C